MEGTVKWFNPHKAYGFIAGDDGNDYFVHLKALGRGVMIREKDRVSFEAVETDRGKQAQNVTLAGEGSSAPSEPAAEEEPAEEEPEEEAEAEEESEEEAEGEEPEEEAEPEEEPEDSEDF